MLSFAFLQPFMGQCSTTMKRRLRVDFEMDHKRAQHDVMSTYFGLSKRQCMMQCAADTRCTAFNFRSGDGFCEHLSSGLPKCYEPEDDSGFIFTQLKLPDFKPLMTKQSKPPDANDLQWVPCNSTTVPSSSNIKVTDVSYVSLGFSNGMYLPAFWKPLKNLLKFIYPLDNRTIRCDHGYVLSVKNLEQYQWMSFQTGNPIPFGSVSAGSHVDGTPLYIARVICEDGKRSGFYSSPFKRAFVSCQKPLHLDGEIEILIHGWYVLWATVSSQLFIQYIPRNMHTALALLCFVVVMYWLIYPYPSGLIHWHCGNLTIAPVPAKQPW